jgi:hypothetical protein
LANTAVRVRQPLFAGAQSVPEPQTKPKKFQVFQWNTHGTYLTRSLRKLAEVSFIGEQFSGDTISLLVLLTSDPESVLDKVYSEEQNLYKVFPKAKFSLRVKTDPAGGDLQSLIKQYLPRWVKPRPADVR